MLIGVATSLSTVSTTYCIQQPNGTQTPWTFQVDPTTSYIYLPLPTQATKHFVDIFDIFATINSTGTVTYGPPVANIATIVDSSIPGSNVTNGGSVITQFSMLHIVRIRHAVTRVRACVRS